MLAVGELVLATVDPMTVRAATGFGGGVGSTRQELCGAFTGGILLLGLLHGRATSHEDDTHCLELVRRWRAVFLQEFGTTLCQPIYDRAHAPDGPGTCAWVGDRAASALFTLLSASAVPDSGGGKA